MRTREAVRPLSLSVMMLLAACGGGSATAAKTELLPPDGGDLGKAFTELVVALSAGDKAKAGALLDSSAWHMDNKQPEFLKSLAEQNKDYSIAGGKRQGDVATLFLVNKQPYYATVNATHASSGWRFDSPLPTGTSFGDAPRDCKATPQRFPCGAASAPDAQVSGHVQSHRKGDALTGNPKADVFFDGIAVRMIDAESKALKGTRLVLGAKGINPQMLALSHEPDDVAHFVNYPVIVLNAAPDGKSGKLSYFDGYAHRDIEVREGLTIDSGTPNRVRGRLKLDAKDAADFDIAFDLGNASECIDGAYQCATD